MKTLTLAFLALSAPLFLVPACGGAVSGDEGSTPDGGSGNGSDAGSDGGGGNAKACPATMQTSGACSPEGIHCEYGTSNGSCDNPSVDCEHGQWTVPLAVPRPQCHGTEEGCPGARSDITPGATCGDTDRMCSYEGQGRCACSAQVGGPVQVNPDGGELPKQWRCETPQTGCPADRPRVGSACSSVGQSCDYGACSIPDGVMIDCSKNAIWEFSDYGCAG
ncbi:MAG: hypothetical protein ABI551_11035 [Polyangiaceae bacterium]